MEGRSSPPPIEVPSGSASSTPYVRFPDEPDESPKNDAVRGVSFDFRRISTKSSRVSRSGCISMDHAIDFGDQPSLSEADSFKWNHKKCTGNDFHKAVLDRNVEGVRAIVDADPDMLRSRFHYSVEVIEGQPRNGSGEAIHIAASRGMMEMTRLLLELKSDVNAVVDLDESFHYSVIHAAVYAEGFGGSVEMVKFLLSASALPIPNKAGLTLVHLAYQTSSVDLIKYLQDVVEVPLKSENPDPPLKSAIIRKKMKKTQLAEVAPLTSESLRLFIHYEPGCVHSFLDRVHHVGVSIDELGMLVEAEHVLRVLRDSKPSANKLLDLLRVEPEVEDPGHHPLPSRMSFHEQSYFRSIRLFNPPKSIATAYCQDKAWKYDGKRHKAPKWHKELMNPKGSPVPDVDVSVNVARNLISPEFFGALLMKSTTSIKGADDILIFQNITVKSAIDVVWWGGAYRVELAQYLLTLTGLVALMHDARHLEFSSQGYDYAHGTSVAVAFVGSRAWLELLHKLAQFAGTRRSENCFDYIEFRDVFELLCCLTQMLFSYWPDSLTLQVLVILIYWVRMLEVNFAANLSRELLPIVRLGGVLGPSIVVSFIFFAAFTHILYVIEPNDLSSTIYHSFCLLIEGSVADKPSPEIVQLFFTYASQLLFTVFLLNVFIGVIGENYSTKKERAYEISQQQRSIKCMEFLFNSRSIPCGLCSKRIAVRIQIVALLVNVIMQVSNCGYPFIFFICQVTQIVGAYQDNAKFWARDISLKLLQRGDFYLWSFVPCDSNHPEFTNELQLA